MAIAFDTIPADTFGTSAASIESSAYTMAGSNRCDFAALAAGAGTPAAHNAVKRGGSGGTDYTQCGSTLNIGSFGRLSVWRLVAPSTSSLTLYGAYAASQDEIAIGASNYTGVDQTTPIGTVFTNTGTATGSSPVNMTVSVTGIASGDWVYAAFWAVDGNGNSPLMTPNGTPTPNGRYEVEGSQLTFEALQIQDAVSTGTSITMSCAIQPTSGSMSVDWGVIAFKIAAATGGGGVFIKPVGPNFRLAGIGGLAS